ncbi:hypothetical protein ACS3SW_15295 [Roseobacteraceae bacterium S113]
MTTITSTQQQITAGGDTALLLLTCAKYEAWARVARENVSLFWDNHPPMFVVTDGAIRGDNVFNHDNVSFVELLGKAVADLKAAMPSCRYVYLLLEDLAPLAPVDVAYLEQVETKAKAEGVSYFQVLWKPARKTRGQEVQGASLAASFAGLDVRQLEPETDAFYSLTPCFWRLDHLEDVVSRKLSEDIHDPWGFEHGLQGDQSVHLVTRRAWPSLVHGVLIRGSVSKDVIRNHGYPNSPLLDLARREYTRTGRTLERIERTLSMWHNNIRRHFAKQQL